MASPVEQLYETIYGELPSKSGAAFERLASIAIFLLEGGEVRHDANLRGQFSKTLYQLDVHHKPTAGDKATMGEAKDYSNRGAKVGRGDLQKLGGALPDLAEIKSGAFFSATGFTAPAKKYAQAAKAITGGKEINLYELLLSTEQDENGFVKKIIINVHFEIPAPSHGQFIPALTEEAQELLKSKFLKEGESKFTYQLGLSEFFDASGSPILSLETLTTTGYGEASDDDKTSHGCYLLPGHHLNINGVLAELKGLEYHVPHEYFTRQIIITDDSTNRFVVKDESGESLLILTDKRLREFSFDDQGNLLKK
ncbi:restriction endonuclease [Methylomonas methanica]|uniref:Restriction endonuclease type IV Mrr domain-containing protein n=1 Tax=Methylomonas methanica TaxID=421 RepID=A0A177LVX4_METMH|nr:restriction endonuclease [Methylomonas methanica]OAH97641.1 hypothetical protein A1332_04375 [Methylomonas methanica]